MLTDPARDRMSGSGESEAEIAAAGRFEKDHDSRGPWQTDDSLSAVTEHQNDLRTT